MKMKIEKNNADASVDAVQLQLKTKKVVMMKTMMMLLLMRMTVMKTKIKKMVKMNIPAYYVTQD